MNRKKRLILLIMVVLTALVALTGAIVFWKIGGNMKSNTGGMGINSISRSEITPAKDSYISNQLIGKASSKEEALRIADLYGLKLLDCEYGSALFEITDGRDPVDVIEYGKEMQYPELSLNYTGEY